MIVVTVVFFCVWLASGDIEGGQRCIISLYFPFSLEGDKSYVLDAPEGA